MFEALGFTPEQAQARFGFLLNAFRFGAPPHGGMAWGLERIMMVLLGADNIRDVVAFPKVASSAEPMSGAPGRRGPEAAGRAGHCRAARGSRIPDMGSRVNRQKELERLLAGLPEGGAAAHGCSCTRAARRARSYVLEYLSQYFAITLFYYNPNISPARRNTRQRAEEARRLDGGRCRCRTRLLVEEGALRAGGIRSGGLARPGEREPEGGARCFALLRAAPAGVGAAGGRRGVRLVLHDAVDQPAERTRKS